MTTDFTIVSFIVCTVNSTYDGELPSVLTTFNEVWSCVLAGIDPWMCVDDSPAAKSCAACSGQELRLKQ